MLNQLDALIGFVLSMAGVNLLTTRMTPMISALLGLRGKDLAALNALQAVRRLRIECRWTSQSQACTRTPINTF